MTRTGKDYDQELVTRRWECRLLLTCNHSFKGVRIKTSD